MKKRTWILSLLMVCGLTMATVGCSESDDAGDEAAHGGDTHAEPDGHSHDHGPHEGTIADWGGGAYHVEFTVDHEAKQATVYILGDDAKTAAPIAAEEIQLSIVDPEMQVTLTASPLDGEPEGSASRFVGTHDSLAVVQEYEGTITGVVDGTPYSGDFKEEAHEH